ncbi:nuclear cap-binding protein subunit 3-like [Penaeus monodon]|uniref:nuclear cap-binding protein subunit 3-like n=1 Tax=Penaeus monodon TaxID=6687 RepID=UPI0018A740B3|nr:nuclear cap-binding protein subunit 3-like [Penaeus monodon]
MRRKATRRRPKEEEKSQSQGGEDGRGPRRWGEEEESSITTEDVAIPVPPGRWRLGVPCPRTKAILLRFASNKDKKEEGAERKSEYYRKHGNPNYGGIKGLLSESGRRRMREAQRRRELEEQRNKRIDLDNPKNPWGMLAQNWGRKESQEEDRIDYQALLRKHTKVVSQKRKRDDDSDHEDMLGNYQEEDSKQGSDDSDDIVPWNRKIKSPRMKMYADAEQKKQSQRSSTDLRSRLSGGKFRGGVSIQDRLLDVRSPARGGNARNKLDLRAKLMSKRRREPVSVEVDNDRYYRLIASDED